MTETKEITDLILEEVKSILLKREKAPDDAPLFAVFDFDGTCIRKDVQDEVFDYMLKKSLIPNPEETVTIHKDLIAQKRFVEAYVLMAQTLAGFSKKEIINITKAVIEERSDDALSLNEEVIKLMHALSNLGIAIYIISGSPEILVQEMIQRHELPAKCIGVRIKENPDGILGKEIKEPYSMFEGKVECIKTYISKTLQPVFAIGDTQNDFAMISYSAVKAIKNKENDLTVAAREHGWYILT